MPIIVKQGASLGPILNNCSLDEVCADSDSYQYGTVEIKSLEFVDDIVDANNGPSQALAIVSQLSKCLKFMTFREGCFKTCS